MKNLLLLILVCISINTQAQELLLNTYDSATYSANNLPPELVSKKSISIPTTKAGFFRDYDKVLWKDIKKIKYYGSNEKLLNRLKKFAPETTSKNFKYIPENIEPLSLDQQIHRIQQNRKIGNYTAASGLIIGLIGGLILNNNPDTDAGKVMIYSGCAIFTVGFFIK